MTQPRSHIASPVPTPSAIDEFVYANISPTPSAIDEFVYANISPTFPSPVPPPSAIDEFVYANISPTFPSPPDFSPKQQPPMLPPTTPLTRHKFSQPKRLFEAPSSQSAEQEKPKLRWDSSRKDYGFDEPGLNTSIMTECPDTRNVFAKPGPMDPYVKSPNVVGLIGKTFKKFLRDVDAAFVLFYDPSDVTSGWAKRNIRLASEITTRPNHVYAAVDCSKECELCQKQNVMAFPTMKVFARGKTVNTFDQFTVLNTTEMRLLVELAPEGSSKLRDKCCVQ